MKSTTKRTVIILSLVSFLTVSGFLIGYNLISNKSDDENRENDDTNDNEISYSEPIFFDNDIDMATYFQDTNKTGNSIADAFIIENLNFYSTGDRLYHYDNGELIPLDCGISLKTTRLFLIIRNCSFESFDTCIFFKDVQNVVIENCQFLDSYNGIKITISEYVIIDSNSFHSQEMAVSFTDSLNSTITSNCFFECETSLWMDNSENISILHNQISNNPYNSDNWMFSGIYLQDSSNNLLYNNSFLYASINSYNSDWTQLNSTNYFNGIKIQVFENLQNEIIENEVIGFWIFVNCEYITIKNSTSISTSGFLRFYDCNHFLLQNCTFGSEIFNFSRATHLILSQCNNFSIIQSTFITSSESISIGNSNMTIINQNHFWGNDISIQISSANNVSLVENIFTNCKYAFRTWSFDNLEIVNNSLQNSRFFFSSLLKEYDFVNNLFNNREIFIYYNVSDQILTNSLEIDDIGYAYIKECENFSLDGRNQADLIVLDIFQSTNFQIRNFGSNTNIGSLKLGACSQFELINCVFENSTTQGIYVDGCSDFSFTNITVDNFSDTSISVSDCQYFELDAVNTHHNQNGLLISGSDIFSVINSNFSENEENGIWLIVCEDFSIRRCSFRNNRDNGIHLLCVSDSWIIENEFINNSYSEIYAIFTSDLLISNNIFSTNNSNSYGINYLVCLKQIDLYNRFQGSYKSQTWSLVKNLTLSTQYYSFTYTITIAEDPLESSWSNSGSSGSSTTYFSQETWVSYSATFYSINCNVFLSQQYIREHDLVINLEEREE